MSENDASEPVWPLTIYIPQARVRDVLTGALEGGSNYWIEETQRCPMPEGAERPRYLVDHALAHGIEISADVEVNGASRWTLDQAALKRGLRLMAEKHSRHFADLYRKNDDAITSDVLLQLSLFGEIVFG